MDFEPFMIKNFYSKDLVDLVNLQLSELKKQSEQSGSIQTEYELFNRLEFHDHPLFRALHLLQQKRIEDVLKRPLIPSYVFASMYFEGKGKCPRHTDRPQCRYTVDVCFNQKKPWTFFAEHEGKTFSFDMEPGDALILSGTDHPHWRENIQEDNFCDLAFFHYVDTDFKGDLS